MGVQPCVGDGNEFCEVEAVVRAGAEAAGTERPVAGLAYGREGIGNSRGGGVRTG